MTIKCNMIVPYKKMTQFHEILVITGGQYLQNPFHFSSSDNVHVYFQYGDYEKFNELWRMATQNIKEIRSDQWHRKLLNRFRYYFKVILNYVRRK